MAACRGCGCADWKPYLEFGPQPISTTVLEHPGHNSEKFSFDFDWCNNCGHVQIRDVIDLTSLYSEYPRMRSTTVAPYVAGLATSIHEYADNTDLVLEIASNDGMFLEHLKSTGFSNVIGVESAKNCVDQSNNAGVDTIHAFFNLEFAKQFVAEHGHAKVVVARHVVEHIDILDDFMAGILHILGDDGRVIIEVPDIEWAIHKGDFTSFTEQHISYFSSRSLKTLLQRHGLHCEKLSVVPNNWSDALLSVSTRGATSIADKVLPYETRERFIQSKVLLENGLRELANTSLVGLFGGFCRTANLLNFTTLSEIEDRFIVVDDDPSKHGRYLPGTSRSIQPFEKLQTLDVEACVICAVNYEDRIAKNHQEFRNHGRFLTLFPWGESII